MNSNEKIGAEYAQNGSTMGAMLYLLRELPNGVAAHYAIGFSSYISLRKREIRKKINRVFLIMTRLDYDKKRKLISHKVYSTSRIRLIMIGHKYQEQLCNLNKQLTS